MDRSSSTLSKYSKNRWKLILGAVFLLALGIALGAYFGIRYSNKNTQNAIAKAVRSIIPVRENNSDYHYIKPLLTYDFSNVKNFTENQLLNTQLTAYIQDQIKQGNATDISMYSRDLATGSWVSVSENQTYHPASMLKVVIMAAYFKEAEEDATLLQKQLLYTAAIDKQQSTDIDFDQPTNMVVGKSYDVEHLIENMIINSDNGAETLLYDNIDQNSLNNIYTDLGLPSPENQTDYTISAKQYALLLRAIYNGTYLSQQYSEKALSIMSQSTYKNGIIAGLPSGVVAAQKYGEHVNGIPGNVQSVELHNCGIVYGKDAYTICVMTKGQSLDKLANIIKNISQMTYNLIASNDSAYK